LGLEEASQGKLMVKDMEKGEQTSHDAKDVVAVVRNVLSKK